MSSVTVIQKIVCDARRSNETAKGNLEPCVLMDLKIDHGSVREYKSFHVNDIHALELKELIDSEWVAFRVQIEFQINGPKICVYLAKMK